MSGSGRTLKRAIVFAVVVAGLVVSIAPMYWMLSTSLKPGLELFKRNPTLWPHDLTIDNFLALTSPSLGFSAFFLNSIVVSLGAAFAALLISGMAGYSLSRGRYRLRGVFGQVILLGKMLPLIVLVGPLYLLYLRTDLLDTRIGLVLGFCSFGVPFGVWMMKSFIDALPEEVEEAARIDGYGRVAVLFRIVLPMALPGLATTAVFIFIEAWNNLLFPLTLISTTEKQPLPPGLLLSFTGQFKTDWGGMMAASCVTTVPLMVAFFAVQRYMTRGSTAGGLAGV